MTLSTMSQGKKIACSGVLTALAMIFSYIEILIPLSFLQIPGFKLGLANIVVVITAYYIGTKEAATVSLIRIILTAMLFGSVQSFAFSAMGGAFAFLMIVISKYVLKDRVSFVGVSVLCASFHNFGQVCAAALMLSQVGVFFYLPVLLCASVVYGTLVGLLLCRFDRILSGKIAR